MGIKMIPPRKKSHYKGTKAGVSFVCLQIKNKCGLGKRELGESATMGGNEVGRGHIMWHLVRYRNVFGISSKDHWGMVV